MMIFYQFDCSFQTRWPMAMAGLCRNDAWIFSGKCCLFRSVHWKLLACTGHCHFSRSPDEPLYRIPLYKLISNSIMISLMAILKRQYFSDTVYYYQASWAMSKMQLKNRFVEHMAVGLMTVLIDMPYDIVSIKYVHWVWHDTDPNICQYFSRSLRSILSHVIIL